MLDGLAEQTARIVSSAIVGSVLLLLRPLLAK
jgi:hypothetical protein